MEPAMIIDADVLGVVRGFDENLGIGGRTKYQSGEGTDLLLRIMARGYLVRYVPDFVVLECGDPVSGSDYRRKAYSYALGTGKVHALNYSILGSLRALPGPILRALMALLRLDFRKTFLHLSVFAGRCHGVVFGRIQPDRFLAVKG